MGKRSAPLGSRSNRIPAPRRGATSHCQALIRVPAIAPRAGVLGENRGMLKTSGMKTIPTRRTIASGLAIVVLALSAAVSHAAACKKVVIEGDVTSAAEWRTPIGKGWVFRVLPIAPGQIGYSGWDLVVDRAQAAGYPDALLLATLPYDSINEREIGTTYGLRAQDAIGWNPRSFRFLTDPAAFREGQQIFRSFSTDGRMQGHAAGAKHDDSPNTLPMARLLELQKGAAAGELSILDAHLIPGVANPAPYAQNWAVASSRTPHQVESAAAGKATPRGALHWMRFSLTLWLPGGWNLPPGLHAVPAACPQ